MKYRKFGNSDLEVSVLGLGAAPFGSRTNRKQATKALEEAFNLGINFYDTAPFYGQGESEKIIGDVFKQKRDKVIITTKIGLYPTSTLRFASKFKPFVRATLENIPINSIKRYFQNSVQKFLHSNTKSEFELSTVDNSVDSSLERLGSDYIDLLLLHITPQPHEIDQAIEKMKSLQQQGKIRYYGAATHSLEETLMWLERPDNGLSALQVRLNIFERDMLKTCLPAQEKGIAMIAREPFAVGRLIPPSEDSSDGLGFVGSNQLDRRLEFLTKDKIRTIPQASLQFLMQTEGVSVVLAGMSKVNHVRENVAAIDKQELNPEELELIRSITEQSAMVA